MKSTDLYNIKLKVFGLVVFKEILFQIPSVINPFIYAFGDGFDSPSLSILVFTLLIAAGYIYLGYMLIFKTEKIQKVLKLDSQAFETDLSLKIARENVLMIGLIIVAGYIFITEIPVLSVELYR